MLVFEIAFYLFAILSTLFLAFFIFLNRKTKEAKLFSYSIFFASTWITLVFLFFYINNQNHILWIGRSTFAIVLILLFSLVLFVRSFPFQVAQIKNNIYYEVVKIFTVFLSLITLITPLVVKEEIITGVAERETIFGQLYPLWIVYFIFLFFLIIYNGSLQYKKAQKGVEKRQILHIIFGTSIAITIGFLTSVVFVVFGTTGAEKIGPPLGLLIFFGFASYAILRHRLMDIGVATGKVFTYIFTISVIGAIGCINFWIITFLGISNYWAVFLTSFLAGILFKSVFLFFEKISAQYLYYSFYSSQQVLGELSKKLANIMTVDELAGLTTKTIMETMKINRAVILLRDKKGKFEIKKNFGFKEDNGISLIRDNFLIEHLKKTQKPLVYEELPLLLDVTEKEMEKRKIKELIMNMEKIEASLCSLLVFKEEPVGIIVLGEKISRDPYTEQDVELLDNLCKQIAVSVENAKLYSEVQDLSGNLEKKVEDQIKELRKAYDKLQGIDKTKTEFMSIVSHQLRTPLSIIKGHLSMINEGVYDNDNKRKNEILDNVYEANERLINLVNDVLNISRIQSGRVELNKEKTDLSEITRKTVERMMSSASEKSVKLFYNKKEEKSFPKIEIDISKIENVLLNLIDNAIKYTSDGSVEVSVFQEGKKLLVEIKDTGEGMEKQELNKLFETFSRGDAGKKYWIQGTGLGLYIARQFIEMHKGQIWAESEGRGKGSQFYIELPL